jgi:predicted Zn finger-like uncharacterized protein
MHSGLLGAGVLNSISPTKLLENALEMPLMAWSRQSEVTADRAGLLAVGDEALARRVLLTWSIRSATLLKKVNIEEWMKQEQASGAQLTRISEATTSSQMYTAHRLSLLGGAAKETELMRWSKLIQPERQKLQAALQPAPVPAKAPVASKPAAAASKPAAGPGAPADSLRVVCDKCKSAMRVPFSALRGKTSLNVRCPQCKNVITLRSKSAPPSAPAGAPK